MRWWIAGLLFLATVLNYLDRQVLSITAPVLRDQLGMTAIGYSRVLFAFLLAYTIMQAVAGKLIDRVGPRLGMVLAMVCWSTACAMHGLAQSVLHLGIFRFLLGAGEAANWPASVKAIGQWFPPKQRALAVGFFNSGSSVGAVIAPPLIAWLTLTFSWRAAFVATGAFGTLWLIPWLLIYRAEPTVVPDARRPATSARWRELVTERPVLGLMLGRFCCDPVWWFYVFWMPEYLSRERHFSLAQIGLAATVPFITAGLGNLVGGGTSGWLSSRGVHPVRARVYVMAVSAAVMLSGIAAVGVSSAALSVAIISLATFAYSGWGTNVLTLPTDLFPSDRVGSVAGLSGTAAGLGGMISSLSVGWLVHHFSFTPVFALAGVMPLVGAVFILWLVHPALATTDSVVTANLQAGTLLSRNEVKS